MGRRKKCTVLSESNNREIVTDKLESESFLPLHDENSLKTQLDAFKVMMDSRSKSIGTNSPGKEKSCNESDGKEVNEKKDLKAKRMLNLQKMAEAKGSLKNKAIEEYRDRFIEKKLEKRAQRIKDMIETKDKNKSDQNSNVHSVVKKKEPAVVKIIEDADFNIKKTLKLCNIFEKSDKLYEDSKKVINKISKEDEEFLNKLSPSLRKKEDMLSYFKMVPKVISDDDDDVDDDIVSNNNCPNIIKVKLKPKHNKKKKMSDTVVSCENIHEGESDPKLPRAQIKCDVDKQQDLQVVCFTDDKPSSSLNVDHRPKRNVKRPAKYSDDIELGSSDEEYHIFTPKKKKNINTTINNCSTELDKSNLKIGVGYNATQSTKKMSHFHTNSIKVETTKEKSKKKTSKVTVEVPKNPIKLAPIFISKPQNALVSEAKQRFLQSGIPEKLKRNVSQHQINVNLENFISVVHVQQIIKYSKNKVNICVDDIVKKNNNNLSKLKLDLKYDFLQNILNLNLIRKENHFDMLLCMIDKNELLKNIKKSYVKFPVYRTYHLLKGKSKGEFQNYIYPDLDNSIEIIKGLKSNDEEYTEKLCWVDKYKPTSSKQIIGNFTALEEIKKWLQNWTENLIKTKYEVASSGSDFSDFHDSDADSREYLKSNNNVLIIAGDVGSGKTSGVYAVAAELAIKIIEVNASSKRTGKIMLQDLQEATRSHKVDRGKSGSDSSQKMQDAIKSKISKKRGRFKKNKQESNLNMYEGSEEITSQDSARTEMSLILIDDADVVFEQDDGFCSAVSQLIQRSKRPVILVTSSLTCPHLHKFIQIGKIVQMRRFLPHMLGVWIDILCLADIGTCCPGLGTTMLDFYHGDIRKTMNCLQFYMTAHKNTLKTNDTNTQDSHKLDIEDESSSMSWADQECADRKNIDMSSDLSKNIDKQMTCLMIDSATKILGLWRALPKMFNVMCKKDEQQITTISTMLDNMSVTDIMGKRCSNYNVNITGDNIFWCSKETPSVVETEIFDYYNKKDEVSNEIVAELTLRSIEYARKTLLYEKDVDIDVPGYSVHREREKVVSRYHTLTNYLNPAAVLDRKALALDYWSSCRTICRLEKNKTESNVKRNNRFCPYLKSLNVLCKNDYFDSLSSSLMFNPKMDKL